MRTLALLAAALAAAPALASDITLEQAVTRITGTPSLEKEAPAPSPEQAELGRKLFFDPRLSSNGAISCAKCHNPGMAWRDGLPRARGLHEQELPRRAPSLLNVSRTSLFFWDGRAGSFSEAALGAIANPDEMNRDLKDVVRDLSALPGYAQAFRRVTGRDTIEPGDIGAALEAFVRAETRLEPSPFDRFLAGDASALSPEAKLGAIVFADKGRCLKCHAGASFSDGFFHNTGVKQGDGPEDLGRFKVTPFKRARRAFKSVPLRDVAVTGPYMHNGSLKTLADVVDFYDRGGDVAEDRDQDMRPLHLTRVERDGLVAFLESLTNPPRTVAIPLLPGEAPRAADAADAEALVARARRGTAQARALAAEAAGRGTAARCRDGLTLDAMIRDYDAGKTPAAVAGGTDEGQAILEDLLFNRTYRAALAGDPKLCDAISAPLVYSGIMHPGSFWCRELFFDAVSDVLLTKRSPAFVGACRSWLLTSTKTSEKDAGAACAAILAGIDDPVKLCRDLAGRYIPGERRLGCEAEFGRYTRFERADVCEGAAGGPDSLAQRCDDYARFARFDKTKDPAACGESEICRLLAGTGADLPAKYERQAKAKYCDALAQKADADARAGLARGAELLRAAEEDLERAEAARARNDRAAAERIDRAAEELARAWSSLEAAGPLQASAAP